MMNSIRESPLGLGLLCLINVVGCALKANQPTLVCTPRADLISWWDGNSLSGSTALDRGTSNANNGTLSSSTSTASESISGVSQTVFTFNGTSSSISIPSANSLTPSSALSLVGWVKGTYASNAMRPAQTIFSKLGFDGTRFTQSSNWQLMGTIADGVRLPGYSNANAATGVIMTGGASDGRYLYFITIVNNNLGTVVRFDSQGDYNSASSWKAVDLNTLTSVNNATSGFFFPEMAFDGTYIYVTSQLGYLFRYNTTKTFDSSASWETLQVRNGAVFSGFTDSSNFTGFSTYTFDGRYLYLATMDDSPGSVTVGKILQFDTTGALADSNSWKRFDGTQVGTFNNANLKGYDVSEFDGRYVYFHTYVRSHGPDVLTGWVMRYDTQLPFTSTSSWGTPIDLTSASILNSANYVGAIGGVFDGRYIYTTYISASAGYMSRFDTQGTFTSSASWKGVDIRTDITGDANYFNCTIQGYDGRFVYTLCNGRYMVQYDTQQDFNTPSSWTKYTALDANHQVLSLLGGARNGAVGVMDGRYLYLPGNNSGYMSRYDMTGGSGSYLLQNSGLRSNGSSMSAGGPSFTIMTSTGSSTVALNTSSTAASTWTHVAATYDGSTQLKLYLNGALAASQASQGTLSSSTANAVIGGLYNSTGYLFNGSITKIGLFSTALTASEVAAIYGGSAVPYCQ